MEVYMDRGFVIPYWMAQDGRKLMIHEMDTSHLVNSAKKIIRDEWRTIFFHFIRKELRERKCHEIELYLDGTDESHDDCWESPSRFAHWKQDAELAIDQHMNDMFPYPDGPDDNGDDIMGMIKMQSEFPELSFDIPNSGRV